jgi:aminopeptidase N
MRHLEQRIGEEALRDGLRDYLRNNAYGNATWPGLIALLDSRSEQNLSAWNEAWVYESGRPRIIVERQSQTGGGFTVRQEDPAGLGRVWPQRLQLLVGEATALEPQIIDLGSEPVVIEGSADLLLPNGSGVEYGDFVLDSQSLTLLLAEIGKVENSVARGAAWTSLWEQISEGRLSAEDFLATALRELPSEPDELIVSRVLRVFDEIYWQRLDRPARIEITPALESLLWTESNAEQRTLSSRAAFYRSYRALATSEQGVERLARLWRGEEEVAGLPLSETDQVALVSGLVLRGIADPESLLDEQESRIRNADRLERFRFIRPSLSASGEVRRAAFYAFTKAENRQREPWVLESLRNIHHPLRQESSIEFVRPALDLLPEIQATGDIFFPGRWLDAVVGRYSSPAAAQAVRDYIEQTPELSPRLVQKLLQSADVLLRLQDIEQ